MILALLRESLVLPELTRDGRLLFLARCLRMFSFGALTVVLMLFLSEIGYSDVTVGTRPCSVSILPHARGRHRCHFDRGLIRRPADQLRPHDLGCVIGCVSIRLQLS